MRGHSGIKKTQTVVEKLHFVRLGIISDTRRVYFYVLLRHRNCWQLAILWTVSWQRISATVDALSIIRFDGRYYSNRLFSGGHLARHCRRNSPFL